MRPIGEITAEILRDLEAAGVREDCAAASGRVIWVDFRQPNSRVSASLESQAHRRRHEPRRFE